MGVGVCVVVFFFLIVRRPPRSTLFPSRSLFGSTALGGVFLGLIVLVELLGYVTWHLTPRDAVAMQRASEFEAIMSSLVHSPTEGAVPVVVPDRRPKTAKAVHRVMEWPAKRGRQFQEAPMLAQRVVAEGLPLVGERLPENPPVIVPPHQNGPYGGTWKSGRASCRESG